MATPLNNHPEWPSATTDGPAQVAAMARSMEKNTVLRFATAAARDAAFTTAGVTPGKGWVCALDSAGGDLYVHDGTTWRRHAPATYDLKFGQVGLDFTTAPVGEAVLAHNLGVTPVFFVAFHDAASSIISLAIKSGTLTSTQVTLLARTDTGAAYNGFLSAVRWMAAT